MFSSLTSTGTIEYVSLILAEEDIDKSFQKTTTDFIVQNDRKSSSLWETCVTPSDKLCNETATGNQQVKNDVTDCRNAVA